jgi:hypothetical protein
LFYFFPDPEYQDFLHAPCKKSLLDVKNLTIAFALETRWLQDWKKRGRILRWSNSLALHPLPLLLLLVAATIVKEDCCCRPTSSRMTIAIERFPSTAVKHVSPPSPLGSLKWCGLIRSCSRNGTVGMLTRLATSIMGGVQIIASVCVSEHTKSLLKSRPASLCISRIADNFPGGKPEVTWGRNKINMFSVNNKFPIGHMRELTHGKIKKP